MTIHTDDDKAIRELVAAFEQGWNAQDGYACARPFAEHADFTAVTGLRARSKELIARGHVEILSTVFRDTRLSATVNDISYFRHDVAVADVTFRLQPKPELPWLPKFSSCGIVATKEEGAWSIGPLDRELLNANLAVGGAG
jgi:uncharacterized protein (TIGR02246 family)